MIEVIVVIVVVDYVVLVVGEQGLVALAET